MISHRHLLPGIAIVAAMFDGVSADDVSFNRDIRPILSGLCSVMVPVNGRVRVVCGSQREAAIATAESGERAIVPGDAAASEADRAVPKR